MNSLQINVSKRNSKKKNWYECEIESKNANKK